MKDNQDIKTDKTSQKDLCDTPRHLGSTVNAVGGNDE